jgi:hypothetical protein
VSDSITVEKVEKPKKALLSDLKSNVNNLYEVDDDDLVTNSNEDDIEFTEEDELILSNLEDSIKNEKTV